MFAWTALKREADALAAKLDAVTQLDADSQAEILDQLPAVRAILDELELRLLSRGQRDT
jgi:hypothetical protein